MSSFQISDLQFHCFKLLIPQIMFLIFPVFNISQFHIFNVHILTFQIFKFQICFPTNLQFQHFNSLVHRFSKNSNISYFHLHFSKIPFSKIILSEMIWIFLLRLFKVTWHIQIHKQGFPGFKNPQILRTEVLGFSHNKVEKLLVQNEAE